MADWLLDYSIEKTIKYLTQLKNTDTNDVERVTQNYELVREYMEIVTSRVMKIEEDSLKDTDKVNEEVVEEKVEVSELRKGETVLTKEMIENMVEKYNRHFGIK